jgi:hypothetical protein
MTTGRINQVTTFHMRPKSRKHSVVALNLECFPEQEFVMFD